MASTETIMSYSSTLTYSTTSGGAYTTLGGMKNIRWAGKNPSTDASALEDTFIVRLAKRGDFGTITADGLFRKTQFAILFTAFIARPPTKYYWKITTSDGSVAGPFYGNLSELNQDVPDDDVIQCSLSIETSAVAGSSPTFTPGA